MSEHYLHLIFPFKLPTWNQLLAMNRWQRKEVRDWLHHAVYMCIASEVVSQTPTGSVRKLSLTALSLAEYSRLIQPRASVKYRFRKNALRQKKLGSK